MLVVAEQLHVVMERVVDGGGVRFAAHEVLGLPHGQVKGCELSANLGWATPGTGSAMIMARGG